MTFDKIRDICEIFHCLTIRVESTRLVKQSSSNRVEFRFQIDFSSRVFISNRFFDSSFESRLDTRLDDQFNVNFDFHEFKNDFLNSCLLSNNISINNIDINTIMN